MTARGAGMGLLKVPAIRGQNKSMLNAVLYYYGASGEVAERFKALVSKTSMGAISSWVRIPPSPRP